jgi:hypothetical protein
MSKGNLEKEESAASDTDSKGEAGVEDYPEQIIHSSEK